MYDIVIIGGGIAGLYTGYLLLQNYPDTKFIILEKEEFSDNAGRINSTTFENHKIQMGAGIGIKSNKLLIKLLDELKIPYVWGHIKQNNIYKSFNKTINKLKKIYDKTYKTNITGLTFKQFALEHITKEEYEELLVDSGYRDFEKGDCYHILNYYNLEDNVNDFDCIYCDWSILIKALHTLLKKHIIFDCDVVGFSRKITFTIITNKKTYQTKNIICATAIDGIKKFFNNKIYNSIIGLSELRVYGIINEDYRDVINKYMGPYQIVKTTNKIQKIIPIDKKNGLYMLAYCDTKNADVLRQYMNNTSKITKFIKNEIGEKIIIDKLKSVYWKISVHCYKPLKKSFGTIDNFIKVLQHPESNILIVGEAVSYQHGWMESALHSVHITLNKFIKKNL